LAQSSESGGQSPGAAVPDGGTTGPIEPQPIGSYLKRQRELRGISIEELATLTRIPLRSLARLESGTFDGQADGFVRGFVRTVASALGLDPDDAVSRMLSEPSSEAPAGALGSPIPMRVFAAAATCVLLAAGVGLVRAVSLGEQESGRPGFSREVVLRRDPVGALAETQAATRVGLSEASSWASRSSNRAAPGAPSASERSLRRD
jgi:hypothetical protein